MEKFDELLKKLNGLEIIQNSIEWMEDIPEDIYKEYFYNNYKEVECNLQVDKHRWYETSITVIEIYGRFLGVSQVSDLFSESMSCVDCYHELDFFEMKQVKKVTYEVIN